jgi:hypothetical protein
MTQRVINQCPDQNPQFSVEKTIGLDVKDVDLENNLKIATHKLTIEGAIGYPDRAGKIMILFKETMRKVRLFTRSS